VIAVALVERILGFEFGPEIFRTALPDGRIVRQELVVIARSD
jgi:hypothetical protein